MKTPRPVALLMLAAAAACARHSGDVAGLVIGTPPRFETRTEVGTNSAVHADYHVADLDGDGKLDMAVCSLTGELRVMIGNGTDFVLGQQLQVGGLPVWMAGGDFDGDGDQDIVIVRTAENATDVWFNDGQAGFTQGPSLAVPMNPLAVVVGDVDADGALDIAVSVPAQPEIRIFYGDGAGAFPGSQSIALPGGGKAFNLQLGDVTRDGTTDLLVADPQLSRVLVYPGDSGGGYLGSYYCELQIPGAPAAIALGDLSGDGLPDMCVSAFDSNRYVVVTEILGPVGTKGNDGVQGGVGDVCDYLSFDVQVPDRPSIATIADATGDGLPDLVSCLAFRASILVAAQLPGGGVDVPAYYDSTGIPLRPFVGDFDGNGKGDVSALSGLGDRINLWRSDASGKLLGARNFESGLVGASWMVGGDFDGDGDSEVIVGSDLSSGLSVLGRGPQGGLVVESTFDIGAQVRQLEAVDLDVDGRLDLIVGIDGGLRLLRNVASGSGYSFEVPAGVPATVGTAAYPFGATAADFDRDGDMDIAYCDFGAGNVHVLLGTPAPFVFGAEATLDVGGGPIDIVSADFTGDGLVDLAVSRVDFSDIAILRNAGSGTFVDFLGVPVGDSPNYLITSDFNLDGRADLVVSNGASGSVSVLFGSPTGFAGQSFAAGSAPTALMAADLTSDGFPDILVVSLVSGDFRVLVGDGKGGFPQLPTFPGTWGASNAVLQDMDADGRPDLLVSSLVTHRVSLVRNIRD